jgi:hypothetical protein
MLRTRIAREAGWGLVTLVAVSGCGGDASRGPATAVTPDATSTAPVASSAPAASSTPAGVTSSAASTAGSSAPAAPATSPGNSAAPPVAIEPTDTRELVKVLDLGTLASPVGSTVGNQSATRLQIAVPLATPAAARFYMEKLDTLGWKPVGPNPDESITDAFAQLTLEKGGYTLLLAAMPSNPNESNVTIEHVGNLDTRALPKTDGAEEQYSSRANTLYFTSATVDDTAAAIGRLLGTAGWQSYDRAFAQTAKRADAADMLFRKKAYSLSVSVSKSAANGKTAVQYNVKTLAHDLPAPPDAKQVQLQDERWVLMCEVPRTVAATAEYYRNAMAEVGFASPPRETTSGEAVTLSFEADTQDLVLVSLQPAGEQSTKVKLEGFSAAFREKLKQAQAESLEKSRAAADAEADAAAKAKAAHDKAFEDATSKQSEMIDAAIGDALKDAAKSLPPDISKKLENDLKTQQVK